MIKSDFPAVFAHASKRMAQCYQMARIKIPAEIFRRMRGSYKNYNSGRYLKNKAIIVFILNTQERLLNIYHLYTNAII